MPTEPRRRESALNTTTPTLDTPLADGPRIHGTATWYWRTFWQRNSAGNIHCALCYMEWHGAAEREMEWDRIEAGGEYTLRNVQIVCPSCNKAKNNMRDAEARAYLLSVRGLTLIERKLATYARYNASPKGKSRDARYFARMRDMLAEMKAAETARLDAMSAGIKRADFEPWHDNGCPPVQLKMFPPPPER